MEPSSTCAPVVVVRTCPGCGASSGLRGGWLVHACDCTNTLPLVEMIFNLVTKEYRERS